MKIDIYQCDSCKKYDDDLNKIGLCTECEDEINEHHDFDPREYEYGDWVENKYQEDDSVYYDTDPNHNDPYDPYDSMFYEDAVYSFFAI